MNVSGLAGIGSLTVAGVTTTTDHINIDADDKALRVGDGQDIQIFHNSTTAAGRFANSSYIENNTGNLFIRGIVGTIIGSTAGEIYSQFLKGDKCELRFNNNVKFVTTNTGIDVTGKTETDSLDVSGHAGIGSFSVAGVSTFAGAVDINNTVNISSGLVVNSGATLDSAQVSDLTNNRVVIAGAAGELEDDANLTFNGTVLSVGVGLDVDGHAGIGSLTVAGVTTSTGGFVGNLTGTATLATDLAINGTNQIVYQDSNNDSDVLPTGSAGQILASSGAGAAPQWVNSAPAGAIEGITIRDESSIVGTANSISTINFIGSVVTADAAVGAGIATVTVNAIAGLGISEGSGSKATGATGLDFVGPLIGVDASSNTGISTVRVDALTIKDEGSTVGTAGSITTINFVGSGIAAAVSGDTATVTSSGGVTNADVVALAIALG